MILNQLQVARLTLRVMMNHLNEAIFLLTDDGRLSYCNNLGIKIVKEACSDNFVSDKGFNKYFTLLGSMEFLTKDFFNSK